MPDVAEQPAKPPRTWRPMVGWTLGILAALGLAWFVGAVAVPVWRLDRGIAKYRQERPFGGPDVSDEIVTWLGGPELAIRAVRTYLLMPAPVASEKVLALRVLGRCGRQGVPLLITATEATDPEVRTAAFYSLSNLGPDAAEAVPQLIALIDAPNEYTRAYAIMTLRDIGPGAAPAVPRLVQLLAESDEESQVLAVMALDKIGYPAIEAAIPSLERLSHDCEGRHSSTSREIRAVISGILEDVRCERPGP